MPLISCKVELSLKWIENCVLTTAAIGANANATGADSATFKITDAKLYVPIVTLSIEDNSKLSKLLNKGFKKPIYWNECKVTPNKIVEIDDSNEERYIRELLVVKELKDYFFLLVIILQVIIKFLLILTKNTFCQELK